MQTSLWLIRHALVSEAERAQLYGIRDVGLCDETLVTQASQYQALAAQLPRPAVWMCTPLSRTRRTAEAIFAGGYPAQELLVEPGMIEQNLGDYQGLRHAELPALLTAPAHPFWPLAAEARPPGGESVAEMLERVGPTIEAIAAAHAGQDVVIVSHGGAIRAAVAHVLGIDAYRALQFSVQNLSLTRLDLVDGSWRVVCVNEMIF